jgi:hypothetical protein
MEKKDDFYKQQEGLNKFFAMVHNCTKNNPDEDRCQLLLDGALKIAQAIKNPTLADNFESKWNEAKNNIKAYADPFIFRRYELDISLVLKKILAPARMEL